MSETPPRRRRSKDNHEFGVVRLRELPVPIACCDNPERIYDYWMASIATAGWYSQEVECLCVIHLNTRRRTTGFHLAGIGTRCGSHVPARSPSRQNPGPISPVAMSTKSSS